MIVRRPIADFMVAAERTRVSLSTSSSIKNRPDDIESLIMSRERRQNADSETDGCIHNT